MPSLMPFVVIALLLVAIFAVMQLVPLFGARLAGQGCLSGCSAAR